MKYSLITVMIALLIQDVNSQNKDFLSYQKETNEIVLASDSLHKKHFRIFFSPGIFMFKENDVSKTKLEFSLDLVPQLNEWLYLDIKGEMYEIKTSTYETRISVLPAAGFEVINSKFMMMAGTGVTFNYWGSVSVATHGAGNAGISSSTFARLQFELVKNFGIYTEARYSFFPYDTKFSNQFFINAGVLFTTN